MCQLPLSRRNEQERIIRGQMQHRDFPQKLTCACETTVDVQRSIETLERQLEEAYEECINAQSIPSSLSALVYLSEFCCWIAKAVLDVETVSGKPLLRWTPEACKMFESAYETMYLRYVLKAYQSLCVIKEFFATCCNDLIVDAIISWNSSLRYLSGSAHFDTFEQTQCWHISRTSMRVQEHLNVV